MELAVQSAALGPNASEWGGYYANLSFSLLRPIQDKWTFDGAAGKLLQDCAYHHAHVLAAIAPTYFGTIVYGVPSLVKES